MNRARILVFTGDGKGKTTAALGMALRAIGNGMKVKIIQFVKQERSGEVRAMEMLPGVEIEQVGKGFVPKAESPTYSDHCLAAKEGLDLAEKAIRENRFQMVILDEICTAVAKGLLEESEVLRIVSEAADSAIIVLTGRSATQGMIDQADTVTRMECVKHGLQDGVKSQLGVEK
jgi:cob(I)alamin adenosyltransferase